jgi:ATP-dependent DNA helicase Rep
VRAQFTAVGDDDQAIYGWRGADIENLRKLPAEFPNLKVIKLEQNYRSTVRILKAANNVIANNEKLFDKKLWSELATASRSASPCRDNDAEAEGVVMKLQAHRFEQRTQFKDYAILYRSNHQARIFEEYLRDHRIPYLLSGGKSFFDKAEIKDIIAYLRLLANEDDDPAFIRAATTPKRGIGATLQVLGTYAGERHVSLFRRPSRKASRTASRRASSNPCSNSGSSSIACRSGPGGSANRCCPTCSRPSTTKPTSTTMRRSA